MNISELTKNKLIDILKQYDFIYIDNQGQLHILIPIIRAFLVRDKGLESSEQDKDNPRLLFFIGDNTCRTLEVMNNFLYNMARNFLHG